MIQIDKGTPYKTRYNYNLYYAIGLHIKNIDLFKNIQIYFKGAGNIIIQKDKLSVYYSVSALKDLEIILNHFFKLSFMLSKTSGFHSFRISNKLIKINIKL